MSFVDLELCWDRHVFVFFFNFIMLIYIKYCFRSHDALIIDSDSIIGLLGALINASLGMSGSDSEDIDGF